MQTNPRQHCSRSRSEEGQLVKSGLPVADATADALTHAAADAAVDAPTHAVGDATVTEWITVRFKPLMTLLWTP